MRERVFYRRLDTQREARLSIVRLMLDGRSAERYAITLPVEVLSVQTDVAGQALMRNVSSQGGVFLYVRRDYVTGNEIDFAIVLPEQLTHRQGMRLECKADVVRIEPDDDDALVGVAAKITSLTLAGSKQLEP